MRGSPSAVVVPNRSASGRIVRNFMMWKARPSRPIRRPRYRIGPGDVRRTAAATASSTGDSAAIPTAANATSKARLATS